MQYRKFNRVNGFMIALGAGILACLAFALTTQHFWYPGPLFWADGGIQGLTLIAIVELILGPVLTAYLLAPNKKASKLKLDLACVVALQLTAFSIGGYIVYSQRPVAVAYFNGSFHTVSASALHPQEKTLKMLERFGDHLPVWIYPETGAISDSQSSAIFPAKDRWDDIKLGTSEALNTLARANKEGYLRSIREIHYKRNIIVLEGRYKTTLANVDSNFEFL